MTYCMLEWLEAHQLSCWIKSLTGIECPGCGMQRALILLLKGELWASITTYPALLPLMLFLILALLKVTGVKKITSGWIKTSGFVCLGIILISYLLKLTIT